jgi:hypothetical protein
MVTIHTLAADGKGKLTNQLVAPPLLTAQIFAQNPLEQHYLR